MIKKFLDAKTKTAEKDGSFEIIASMGKRDRMGDLIDPKGWYLKNYKKNPVILWSHSTGGFGSMAIPPVGKATKTWIDNEKELRMKGQFAETPFAQELKTLVNGGFLNAVSVGFLPLVEDIKGTIDIEEKIYRRVNEVEMKAYSEGGSVEINEKIYGKGGEVFSKQELLEVSWVSVPALPQALVTAKEMNLGLVTKAIEQEMKEEEEVRVENPKEEADKEIGEEEVMDLTVENNHNYYLGNGVLSHNSSIDPVQPKFESGLLPGETPTGMNVVTLRPTFFKTVSPEKHNSNFWYSVDMRELSKADFMTMMNVTELTQNQQVSMELIYQELRKRYDEDEELEFSVEMINEIIDAFEELNTTQKTSLKFKFRPLEHSQFFEKEYKRNIVSLMRKGYVPAINVENFDSFGKGAFLFPEVTLNIVLREVILARRKGLIKPVFVVLDEASRFVGNRKRSSLKESILQCLEENTLIKTKEGNKKIKDLDENNDLILSYNENKKESTWSKFHKFGEDKKELYEIELENGKKIECSEDHRLFKMGFQNKFEEKKIKELKIGDKLVCENFCICGKAILKQGRKYCSKKCASKGYDHSWKFGRKNPHTKKTKDKIRKSVRKIYDDNIDNIKGKISKSSKRPYEKRMGMEKSNELKSKKSINGVMNEIFKN
jgi:phage head maturation protease